MTKTALLSKARQVAERHTPVCTAYEALGIACAQSGPLDDRTRRLIALAVGRGSEGAVQSHVRRALDEGLIAEELRHVALLAAPTLGFPATVAALSWIGDLVEP